MTAYTWAIVLAAGEGTRLRPLTSATASSGVPKQFWSLTGRVSMLQGALRRARHVAEERPVITVVAPHQRRWWAQELARAPGVMPLVQPESRGTADGVLLPLMWIARQDPQSTVAIFPADHFVAREAVLLAALRRAVAVASATERVVLLGMQPEEPVSGYGWIVPGSDQPGAVRAVRAFVEKPPAIEAARLALAGALVNSFLLVGRARVLLDLYEGILPELLRRFDAAVGTRSDWSEARLVQLYASLPSLDFSRDLLERACSHLAVLPVQPCGWTDLGTPERVRRCLAALQQSARRRCRPPETRGGGLDLAVALSSSAPRSSLASAPQLLASAADPTWRRHPES